MSDPRQYLTFGLAQDLFGIDIQHVREVLDPQPVAALPHAPPFLLGMTDVRGISVPVVDLRLRLGMLPLARTPTTRIVMVNAPFGGRVAAMGLVADRVFEVTALDGGHLEPAPEVGGQWQSRTIAGIGRKDGAFVVVFDLERLMIYEAAAIAGALDGVAAAA